MKCKYRLCDKDAGMFNNGNLRVFCSNLCSHKHDNQQTNDSRAASRAARPLVVCLRCQKTTIQHTGNPKRFCSKFCKNGWNARRLSNERRSWLIALKGGRCIRCGYDKCQASLNFHHRNPTEKLFDLSKKHMTKPLEQLKREVEKCDLVCANCHGEIHHLENPLIVSVEVESHS